MEHRGAAASLRQSGRFDRWPLLGDPSPRPGHPARTSHIALIHGASAGLELERRHPNPAGGRDNLIALSCRSPRYRRGNNHAAAALPGRMMTAVWVHKHTARRIAPHRGRLVPCGYSGVLCRLVATRDGSSRLPGLRRWADSEVAVTVLVVLAACGNADKPPTVASSPPEDQPTVLPAAPRGSRTAPPGASDTAKTVLPEAPKSSETMLPVSPRNSGKTKPPVAKNSKAAAQRPDHIVIVIFENKHRSSVIGNPRAPYLNKLARQGANMTRSYGITHPSQPNYLALFSGSTHGVSSNACLQRFKKKQNLGSQLRKAGYSFTGYAEALPKVGYTGCVQGRYQRKHNPWVNFANLPRSSNQPFSAFPRDYRKLPTVSFVSPDMCNSMHDCSIRTGDRWMKKHFNSYAKWAKRNNSWLIVTFDENAGGSANPIPTIIVGQGIRPGRYSHRMDHYTMLRTIQKAYGLPPLGRSQAARPLSKIWKK
jgi:hypothetical protein